MNAATLVSVLGQLRDAARHHQTSVLFQVLRFRRLHNRSLFSLEDFVFWGLGDPAIPSSQIDYFMSREARVRLQLRFNNNADSVLANDKAIFYKFCADNGFPIPAMCGLIHGEASNSKLAAETVASDFRLDDLADGDYVAKPAQGSKGKGVFFFEKADGRILLQRRDMTLTEAQDFLQREAAKDCLVVQERVKPQAELSSISGSTGVQSVRVVTFLKTDGSVCILFARFKFLTGNNVIDNFDDGKTGNLIAAVDSKNGQLKRTFTKRVGVIGLEEIHEHPETGASLSLQLPYWQEVLNLVSEAAKTLPRLRLLGWDVALSDSGPVLLEANQNWEAFPIAPYQVPKDEPDWNAALKKHP